MNVRPSVRHLSSVCRGVVLSQSFAPRLLFEKIVISDSHNVDSVTSAPEITIPPKKHLIMVHYWCYAPNKEHFEIGERVFKVAVGENSRDQSKRVLLECFAEQTCMFFRPWDSDTDYWLESRFSSQVKGCSSVSLKYESIPLKVADLYRHIIDGDLDSIRPGSTAAHNLFHLYAQISPSFFFSIARRAKKASAFSEKRKHLSQPSDGGLCQALIGFAIIAIIFLLAGYIEHIEYLGLTQ